MKKTNETAPLQDHIMGEIQRNLMKCQDIIHGLGNGYLFRGLRVLSAISIILACLHLHGGVGHAEDYKANDFIAPAQGVKHIFESPDGLTRELLGIEYSDDKLYIQDKICCFPYNHNSTKSLHKKSNSSINQMILSTDGTKILLETHLITTLADLKADSWSIPISVVGPKASEYPNESTCEVISKKNTHLFGQSRLVIDVKCTVKPVKGPPIISNWTLASGLGFIQIDNFELVRIEKNKAK